MNGFDLSGHPVRGLARALAAEREAPAAGLQPLPWFPFEVLTSPGCRRAAARLARRAERAYWYLRQALDFAPRRLRLVILDRDAWPEHAETCEFGLVHVNGAGDLVIGCEPADAWTDISAWFAEHLDKRALGLLTSVHGEDPRTRGPALGVLAETLIAHELAHVFAESAGVRFPRRWLAEAFANYAMVAVLGETDPLGLRRLGSLAEAARTVHEPTPPLAQFEAEFGRMDLMASVLAQLALTRGVYQTYAAAQAAPLGRLFRMFATNATPGMTTSGDHDLMRALSMHAHPTIAEIPQQFPAAPYRAAA
jgi:hypothetical protein